MYCLSIESSNILNIQVGINNEFKLAFCVCAFEKVEREINFNEVGKAQHVKWFYFKNYSDVIAVFILRYVETKNENVFWLDTSCIYLFLSIKVCPYSRGIPTNFPNYEEYRLIFHIFLRNFLITLLRFLFLILHHIPRNIKEKQSVFCTTQFMILKTIYSVCVGVKQAYTITNLCILDDWWSQLLQIYYIILSKDLKE